MIRVVIDTGVVVSAAFRDRAPEEIILFIVGSEDFQWVVSRDILAEYKAVLSRKTFDLPPPIMRQWHKTFEECTITLEPDIEIAFPRDKKDAMFLECALAGEADYLITGDKDFEEAQKLIRTTIISVAQFKSLVIDSWT